ncbi:unnamed protein product [Hydatigera taeniaeformis]|uniref:Lipoprotein n=1 Tax=Hydatigena taeniaeformis TaxID=6205 RepID=A0A0R3XA91_HYDTA|nr:unnamed protein product [Hydatigera taeniaeformis]
MLGGSKKPILELRVLPQLRGKYNTTNKQLNVTAKMRGAYSVSGEFDARGEGKRERVGTYIFLVGVLMKSFESIE